MNEIEATITDIKNAFSKDLNNALKSGELDILYLKYFSKTHGIVTDLLKELPKLSADEKRVYGPALNELQDTLKQQIEEAKANYQTQEVTDASIDLTLLVQPKKSGMLHPTTQVIREINSMFRYYGFSVMEGPEIETAENNFRKLNLPDNHPATDLQDTLYLKEPEILLRTQTSSVESRILTDFKPPIRAVIAGKCYRNETASKTNASFFHQYQGVVVDKGITIQHLKGMIEKWFKFILGENIELRFRYKYYPEVSPGLGTDFKCVFCHGKGCEVCKYRGWTEVGGSGMIHYNTLKMCGIDPNVYTGFAFGMGLDRMVMAKYGIGDIRKLYGGGMAYN